MLALKPGARSGVLAPMKRRLMIKGHGAECSPLAAGDTEQSVRPKSLARSGDAERSARPRGHGAECSPRPEKGVKPKSRELGRRTELEQRAHAVAMLLR